MNYIVQNIKTKYVRLLNIFQECANGFFGLNCSRSCPFPLYGNKCLQTCSCEEVLCDFMNGCKNGKYNFKTATMKI